MSTETTLWKYDPQLFVYTTYYRAQVLGNLLGRPFVSSLGLMLVLDVLSVLCCLV